MRLFIHDNEVELVARLGIASGQLSEGVNDSGNYYLVATINLNGVNMSVFSEMYPEKRLG